MPEQALPSTRPISWDKKKLLLISAAALLGALALAFLLNRLSIQAATSSEARDGEIHSYPLPVGEGGPAAEPGLVATGQIQDGDVRWRYIDFGTTDGANTSFEVPLGLNHLGSAWWWYRVEGDTQEESLGTPDTESYNGDTAVLTWSDVGGWGFDAELVVKVIAGGVNEGTSVQNLRLINVSTQTLTIDVFSHVDYNLDGSVISDTAVLLAPNYHIALTDATFITVPITAEMFASGPISYQVATYPYFIGEFNDIFVTNLNNTGLPYAPVPPAPDDFSGAFQWQTSIPAGQSASFLQVLSINEPAVVPPPSIQLSKTVGLDPSTCAGTSSIRVLPGTQVVYCYQVVNTGFTSFSLHDLVDSQLGTILNDFPITLNPASTVWLTRTAVVSQTTTNDAVWTAFNAGPTDVVSGTASATVTILAPEIELAPESLQSDQDPNQVVNKTLTISNTGGANLIWSLTEIPAPTVVTPVIRRSADAPGGQSLSASGEVHLPPPVTQLKANQVSSQLVEDGSFENGPPAGPPPPSAWTETSSTPCEWIGNWAISTWGNLAAFDGIYDYWAGGYCQGTPSTDSVSQTVTVPLFRPILSFWYVANRTALLDPPNNDLAYVSVDGVNVWTLAMTAANNSFPNWVNAKVDLSAYAGQTVDLAFGADSRGSETGNVRFDFIEFLPESCNPADLPWVSASPTNGNLPSGSNTPVNVAFNSTGLAAGFYSGALCITSNDQDDPVVVVPLALSVDIDADLTIAKGDSPDPVAALGTLTYTLTVSNQGPDPANQVEVVDTLPAEVTYQSSSASQGSCAQSGGAVTCELGLIPDQGSATVTIVVTAPGSAMTITNNATVSSLVPDPDPANNSASQSTRVGGAGPGGQTYIPMVTKNY